MLKFLLCAFLVLIPAAVQAQSCQQYHSYLASAEHDLLELDTYQGEDNTPMATAAWSNALHQFDLADHYRDGCDVGLHFYAVHFHILYEGLLYQDLSQFGDSALEVSAEHAKNLDNRIHDFIARIPNSQRNSEASTYSEIKRYAALAHTDAVTSVKEYRDVKKAGDAAQACAAIGFASASMSQDAKAVQPPEANGAVGTVLVKVTLDALGTVTATEINKSSGNASLDTAAITAARASTYSPEKVCGKGTPGSFIYQADFVGG